MSKEKTDNPWRAYYLRKNPFLPGSHIEPSLGDDRLNGKVFSKDGFEKAYSRLIELITRERSICYVRSDSQVRGTGKSALMAGVYWFLKQDPDFKKKFWPVWATVHDFRTINQLMGRVFDTFVTSGVIAEIRKKLKNPIPSLIENQLKPDVITPNPSSVLAISKILSVSDYEVAWKYTNIRRSVPTTSLVEILTYFLFLFRRSSTSRVFVFIDQFEEFVEYQSGSVGMGALANNMKDLHRAASECDNLSFVLSLHPVSQLAFQRAGQEILNSYGDVGENAATVDPLKTHQIVKVAEAYISHYRVSGSPKSLDPDHPFTHDALEFIAARCTSPRLMIRYSQYSMKEAAIRTPKIIDPKFLRDPEVAPNIRLPSLHKSTR